MSFKGKPTTRERRSYFWTDQGSMRATPSTTVTCNNPGEDCVEAEDAGRTRLAKATEQNHYSGGEFRDVEPLDDRYGGSGGHDPVNQRALARAMGIPGTARGGSAGGNPPTRSPVNNRSVGKLGTPVNEQLSNGRVGFTGTAAYDPRTNLRTVGKDPGVMYSTSAGGVAGLKSDQMGSRASTSDVLRRMNQANKQFWQRDANKRPDDDEEEVANRSQVTPADPPDDDDDSPAITRHERTNPDGSKVVVQHEIHPAPRVQTVDLLQPRRQPVLPGAHSSDGTKWGQLRSRGIKWASDSIAEINKSNADKWKR